MHLKNLMSLFVFPHTTEFSRVRERQREEREIYDLIANLGATLTGRQYILRISSTAYLP